MQDATRRYKFTKKGRAFLHSLSLLRRKTIHVLPAARCLPAKQALTFSLYLSYLHSLGRTGFAFVDAFEIIYQDIVETLTR
jgi:hypothetical protein